MVCCCRVVHHGMQPLRPCGSWVFEFWLTTSCELGDMGTPNDAASSTRQCVPTLRSRRYDQGMPACRALHAALHSAGALGNMRVSLSC